MKYPYGWEVAKTTELELFAEYDRSILGLLLEGLLTERQAKAAHNKNSRRCEKILREIYRDQRKGIK